MVTDMIHDIKPAGDYILFTFLDDVWNGTMSNTTAWGFQYQVSTQNTQQPGRWGQVHEVGSEVDQVSPGQYIFIEPLMWTVHQNHNDRKIWWTSQQKVMLVSDTAPTGVDL